MGRLSTKTRFNPKDPWRWAGMGFLAIGIAVMYFGGPQDCAAIQTQWFTGSIAGGLVTIGALVLLLPLVADILSVWRSGGGSGQ